MPEVDGRTTGWWPRSCGQGKVPTKMPEGDGRATDWLLRIVLWGMLISNSGAIPNSPAAITNSSDAATLLALRSSLSIRSRFWPRRADPCSSWIGIACEDGHVVSVVLTGLRQTPFAASTPSSLALLPLQNLPLLRLLNSSRFPLPGRLLPAWLGSLPRLQALDLSSASLSSSLPPSLGNLSHLHLLILARNNLSGSIPSSLGRLTTLTTLDLSSNSLVGSIPLALVRLRNLETMNLTSNQLVGVIPAGLGSLSKLQSLALADNRLEGTIPSPLGNLSSLRNLDLSSNALSGPIPVQLGRLTFLNTLNLSRNSFNQTIPAELSNCTSLQILSLHQNSFTGQLPSSLVSLRNLTSLSLFSNNLTGMLSADFSGLVQVKELLLSGNLFYGTIPFVHANLSKVSKLDLSNNYFEGNLPAPFIRGALLDRNCLIGQAKQRNLSSCRKFYSDRGLTFQGTIESPAPLSMQVTISASEGKDNHVGPVLGGVFGGLGFVFLLMMLMYFVRKREKTMEAGQSESVSTSRKAARQPFSGNISVNLLCIGDTFPYAQLQQATAEFSSSNLIKAGHTGELYQGLLEGLHIVVKRIELGKFKKDGYLAELELFGKASHTRLVPLLGHSLEREDEKLLVYKYMPGRDLGFSLQQRRIDSEEALQSLDWITRLKIAIGAAEGLTYLHHECTPALVHRDIQASSILLDDKFEVRLGSLTEVCAAVGEAHHGVISRILRRPQASEQVEAGALVPTCAYDVYCFGKVLLELISGKVGISGSTDPSTDAWLQWALPFINIYDKESISKIVDPSLIVDEDLMEEVWAMAIVAKSCLNPKPSKRPLMRYILKALENPLKVVREDTLNGSRRSRASSHGSWNAAFFGSWRHSSSEAVIIPGSLREDYLQKNNFKQMNGGSQESGQGEISQRRPGSSEIFPEPVDDCVLYAPTNTNSDKQNSYKYSL